MAAKDNDDLARMLSGMAEGQYAEEPQQGEAHGDSIEAPAPAAPEVNPVAKAPSSPAAPARPPARPLTAMPVVKKRVKPIPTAMPVTPEVAREAPPEAEPTAIPAVEEEAAVEEPVVQEGVDDDAVIVPAPAPEMLAHTHRPRPARAARQHLVQSVGFKRAIIPISWSAGLICLMYVIVGLLSGESSPLRAFRVPWLAASFGLVGLVMIGVGVVTMMQVRNQR